MVGLAAMVDGGGVSRPEQGVRRRRLVAKARVRALCIVVLLPALDDDPRLSKAVEQLPVQQLVAELGVEALAVAVLPRAAGMNAVLAPTAAIHSRTALAMNSGPLSERTWPGTPRRMKRFDSTSMTSVDLSLRSIRIARHSRVNGSLIDGAMNGNAFTA